MFNFLIGLIIVIFLCSLVMFLRVFPFREKKSTEPKHTAPAKLIARHIKSGADRSGRSRLGFNHVLIFRLEDGTEKALYAYEEEYGALREGMEGHLTWQGRYFLGFEQPA